MYGAFDIDSIPPATTTWWSPARIIWSAISTARIDDAQTLLIVSEPTSIGRPAPIDAWRDGACLQHLAHDHVLDLVVLDAGAVERGTDHDRPELGRRLAGERPAELAERR